MLEPGQPGHSGGGHSIMDCDEDGGVGDLLLDESHKILLSIPLESSHPLRSRKVVIISAPGATSTDLRPRATFSSVRKPGPRESLDLNYALLGVDTVTRDGQTETVTLGFVLKILWGLETTLDGDGGFGIHSLGQHFIFKPASLQFLWTAIQTLHAITARLKPKRHSICVLDSDWVKGYENRISSPQSCINEWNEMVDILSRRPPSPDELVILSSQEADMETLKLVMKSKIREIMKTVDLDDITSKSIRQSLEAEMKQNLKEFKPLIDEEILLVLGQMDPASKIFDFLYLGSEWNASNLEELTANGVTHILNVTREIDNFFPAVFKYLNIREWDVEETDLLQYWDHTYRFIRDCVRSGGVCLVHCKMGISRSASTVMSFAMKHFSWSLEQALTHTKERRKIINPNPAFRQQLVTYEGILFASRQRKSFREKGPLPAIKLRGKKDGKTEVRRQLVRSPSEPSVNITLDSLNNVYETEKPKQRPVSWSPHSKFLLEDKGDATANSESPVMYHCFKQLSQIIHDPHTRPCPAPVSATPPLLTPATSKRFYRLPGQDNNQADSGEVSEGVRNENMNTTASTGLCPAQSCLSQCTCDLELELSVSDIPVNIFDENPENETILKNLGSLPIHIRSAQQLKSTRVPPNLSSPYLEERESASETHETLDPNFSDVNPTVIEKDEQIETGIHTVKLFSIYSLRFKSLCLKDTAEGVAGGGLSVEELSVKTLANMFDFRLSDPSMTKNLHKLIKESKLDTKQYCTPHTLSTIDLENCSEC